jgi:hypothetical protein
MGWEVFQSQIDCDPEKTNHNIGANGFDHHDKMKVFVEHRLT